MAYKIVWTAKAIEGFDGIMDYLILNWPIKRLANFIKDMDRVPGLLKRHPEMFQKSAGQKNLHRGFVNKLTYLFIELNPINNKSK